MLTKYQIIPTRIGRRDDLEPFVVVIPDSDETDAQRLSEGLHSYAADLLMSKTYSASVDLKKGTFLIEGGRFGKGRIEIKEQSDDEPEPTE
jgi:hypothetical protein